MLLVSLVFYKLVSSVLRRTKGRNLGSALSFLGQIGKGDANDHSGPIASHFHWLTQPRDYSSISMAEVESEYVQLRRELVLLNEQAARNVERISIKSVKKSNKTIDSGKAVETCMREADNNAAIIARLRIELQQLQKRISAIQQTGKDDIESSIQATREQITYLRHKNKELQQKSKEIGSNIEAGDEVFNEVRKLEVELSIAERKKAKLQLRSKETGQNLQKVRKQLGELNGDAVDAECYIQEQLQQSRVEKVEKRLQSLYRQRTYHMQAIRKNQQSFSNLKQQKYHQCLKQLEQLAARIQRSEESINLGQERHLQSRAEIIGLEQKLKAAIEAEKERKKQQVAEGVVQSSHEKENEKSARSKEQSPAKKHNYRKKIRAEEKPGQEIRSSQQSNNKTRLLNLRFNKSQNKKQDKEKMSHTIDSASAIQRKTKQKQVMKSFEQSTLSYQMPITSKPKINSAELQQNETLKDRQIAAKANTLEDYCFVTENIEEEIGDSFLKEKAEGREQPKQNEWTSVERERESKSVIETPKDKVVEEEADDEDLIDFKRSIEAELTSPFSGLKHVDIALGEIEDSIRKHESKSRQQQLYQESSIAEQEQQLA